MHGYDFISSNAHMEAFPNDVTQCLLNLIPDRIKDHPVNGNDAAVISHLAQNASQGTPAACTVMLPDGEARTEPVAVY